VSTITLDTRNKILQTAIDIAGLKSEVTIREITEKAGVNVAAINYHFGNKNNLLKEVENYYSAILFKLQNDVLMNETLEPRKKLIGWSQSLMEFMLKYPAIINLIVKISEEGDNYSPGLVSKIYLNAELENIVRNIIKKCSSDKNEVSIDYKYTILLSGILGPIISYIAKCVFKPEFCTSEAETGLDIKYIEFLVDSVIK
jgi:AcrR family transcriptional regulator